MPFQWQPVNAGYTRSRKTTRMIYDDSDHLIIECSQEQFEMYRQEERHSRYLQEYESKYLTIPMSDLNDRDQSSESDSVTNQRKLIENFIEHNPDIEIVSEKIDDGYSGIIFDRPAFKEMEKHAQ